MWSKPDGAETRKDRAGPDPTVKKKTNNKMYLSH